MADDDRDLLDVLRLELEFLGRDGYSTTGHRPWRPTEMFRDSPTCPNFGELDRIHPCSECVLFDLVPENRRHESAPCHFIPLDRAGQTVAALELWRSQAEIEDKVKAWLNTAIVALERERKVAG